jgi:hypothetical protein
MWCIILKNKIISPVFINETLGVKCYYGMMLCPVIAQLTENKTAHGFFLTVKG